MDLYFVYADEKSFKKWLRKLIGERHSDWVYHPEDKRYMASISFQYYDEINSKFVPGEEYTEEARKQLHYYIDPYPDYPSYFFFVNFIELDYSHGETDLEIPKKEEEDLGYLEIINIGDGRLQLRFTIYNSNMISIKNEILEEIKHIWKHEYNEEKLLSEAETKDNPIQSNEENIEEKSKFPYWFDLALEIYSGNKGYEEVRYELSKRGIRLKTKTIRNRFSEYRRLKNIPYRKDIKSMK